MGERVKIGKGKGKGKRSRRDRPLGYGVRSRQEEDEDITNYVHRTGGKSRSRQTGRRSLTKTKEVPEAAKGRQIPEERGRTKYAPSLRVFLAFSVLQWSFFLCRYALSLFFSSLHSLSFNPLYVIQLKTRIR